MRLLLVAACEVSSEWCLIVNDDPLGRNFKWGVIRC